MDQERIRRQSPRANLGAALNRRQGFRLGAAGDAGGGRRRGNSDQSRRRGGKRAHRMATAEGASQRENGLRCETPPPLRVAPAFRGLRKVLADRVSPLAAQAASTEAAHDEILARRSPDRAMNGAIIRFPARNAAAIFISEMVDGGWL